MKLRQLAPTDQASRSPLGAGRVWRGYTDKATPVKVLVAGLQCDSDDPAIVARFDREHDTLPDLPTCPDCGEPLVAHEAVEKTAEVALDMYEVIARWISAYGRAAPGAMPPPPGVTLESMARTMREGLEQTDKPYHDALLAAARAVSMYVIEQIMEGQGIGRLDSIGAVAGHA